MGRTKELLNPLREIVALLSVADALVVVMKCWKQHGAKGSTESWWIKPTILWDELLYLLANLTWLHDSEEPYESRGSSTVLREGRGC